MPFKAYDPSCVHVDVKCMPQMQGGNRRRYVFVCIDRATRWVFIAIKQYKTAALAKAFLAAVRRAVHLSRFASSLRIAAKSSQNGCLAVAAASPQASMSSQLCRALGIEHRLPKPKTP